MRLRLEIVLTASIVGLFVGISVELGHSQSFDCKHAKFPDEVVICRDPGLSRLDSELARIFLNYRSLLKGSELRTLMKAQSDWLASRIKCRGDPECIPANMSSESPIFRPTRSRTHLVHRLNLYQIRLR